MIFFYLFLVFARFLILLIQTFKVIAPTFMQSRAFMGAHQAPISILLNSFHKLKKQPFTGAIFSILAKKIERTKSGIHSA